MVVSSATAALVCLVAVGWSSPLLAVPSVAMVSDAHGSCTLTSDEGTKDCAILDYLRTDALQLGAGAELSIVYLHSSNEHRYAGPATLEIGADAPKLHEGEAGETRPVDLLGDSGLAPLEQPFLAQAALVVRGPDDRKKLRLLAPKNSNILDPRPRFRWAPIAQDVQYHFVLSDETGEQLLESDSTDTELTLPAGMALDEEAFYEWQVEVRLDSGQVFLSSADFNIVSATRKAQIEGLRPKEGSAVSDRVIFAALMDQLGFRHEAERQWQSLAEERPDDPYLSRYTQP